ncbi:MAG: heavy-metal-associated domain-containing protein [Thermoleophilia bacterium]
MPIPEGLKTMQKAVLTSAKISCGHCKMTVEKAGSTLEGVDSITADPETKQIEVSFDENRITLGEIRKAIEDAGYPTE